MPFLLDGVAWGAIVPHAPLLVPAVSPGYRGSALLDSLIHVRDRVADAIVVITPHGERTGVLARSGGSLARMGLPRLRADAPADPQLIGELAFEWGEPRLDTAPDHGLVVPLLLDAFPAGVPIIACALEETTGPGKSFSGARGRSAASLAAAIAGFAGRKRIGVVASAHTSAGLAPHAPLTERPGSDAFEERVLQAWENDIGRLLEIDEASWDHADPCGRGPLLVLAHLFQGRTGIVHCHDTSQGVGYLVATDDGR